MKSLLNNLREAYQISFNPQIVEEKVKKKLWYYIVEDIKKVLIKINAKKELYPYVYSYFYERFFDNNLTPEIRNKNYSQFIEIISTTKDVDLNIFQMKFENLMKKIYNRILLENVYLHNKKRIVFINDPNFYQNHNFFIPEKVIYLQYKLNNIEVLIKDYIKSLKMKALHKMVIYLIIKLKIDGLKMTQILNYLSYKLNLNKETIKTIYYRFKRKYKKDFLNYLKFYI